MNDTIKVGDVVVAARTDDPTTYKVLARTELYAWIIDREGNVPCTLYIDHLRPIEPIVNVGIFNDVLESYLDAMSFAPVEYFGPAVGAMVRALRSATGRDPETGQPL